MTLKLMNANISIYTCLYISKTWAFHLIYIVNISKYCGLELNKALKIHLIQMYHFTCDLPSNDINITSKHILNIKVLRSRGRVGEGITIWFRKSINTVCTGKYALVLI